MNLTITNLKWYFMCPLFVLLGSIITLSIVQVENCDVAKFRESKRHYRIENVRNPTIIICILSAPKNLDRRNALRETWLRDIGQKDVLYYFIVGSTGLSQDFLLHLSTEQSKYNDLLILPIEDTYSQLSYKTLQTFVWLDEQINAGLNFSYLLKCDDDSFVRLDVLKKEIKDMDKRITNNKFIDVDENIQSINLQKNSNKNILSVYWGYFKGNANIKTQGKWKETNWILCNNYLPYAQGGGYILSKQLVMYLAKNADDLSLFNSEDVSVGTWLAPIANILRIHDVRFDTEWISRGCQNSHIVFHNIAINEIKIMYSNIKKYGYPCTEEIIKRKKYLYDWSSNPSNCCKHLI